MRLMHLDFVEESYWKRCAAKKFAIECSALALHKAKLRAARSGRQLIEERQREEKAEVMRAEQARREEERQRLAEKRE
jgi:hypothetical protein